MEEMVNVLNFYKGKKVLITGHTGFKGTWLCKILNKVGAQVIGYSLPPSTQPSLYELIRINEKIKSINGDIRDLEGLMNVFKEFSPEIVIHLAAQPIVRDSYKYPVYTYETNVIGTVNILECIRQTDCVKSFLNVTTDKVYQNNEWEWGYRENEPLNGIDPYSNSKSCSELVTHSYKSSFFEDRQVAISTARAGNVIGGGDFSNDRIIPDCVRAVEKGDTISVRNPHSVRPYQHVLESLYAYLLITKKQYEHIQYEGQYNVGPNECDCLTTEGLVSLFCEKWGVGATWSKKMIEGPYEAHFLKLDCSKIKQKLGWYPRWNIEIAVEKTVEWSKYYLNKEDVNKVMEMQIEEFFKLGRMYNESTKR